MKNDETSFNNFARRMRVSVREKSLMKRTSVANDEEILINHSLSNRKLLIKNSSLIRKMPLNGNRDLINFKAMLYAKGRMSRIGSEIIVSGDLELKRGGLGKWFEEEWVDISRPKKGGGFESCGRGDANSGKYPKCVKKSRAASMTPEQIASAVSRKRRAENSETRVDKKPINVSTMKSDVVTPEIEEISVKSRNVPTNPELYARVKAQAKQKFNVYPSAYANAWLVREYKKRGGGYRVEKDDREGLEEKVAPCWEGYVQAGMKKGKNGKMVPNCIPIKQKEDESETVEEKAGIIGSGNPVGRAIQGVGSFLAPGNISPITSPIRSRVYGALVPGGGQGVLSRLKPNRKRQARCPAGFEFGGRFTDNRFSTCGAQLFEIPGPLELISRAIRPTATPKLPQARAENLSEVLEGNPSNARTIQISRMAQIPRTGAFQKDKFNRSVADSIKLLKGAPKGEGRMIRRDGVILRPVVPSSVLRSFSENPDMVDGAMIRAIQLPADIGADDLALLGGPSMSKIAFVAPNGVTVSIERSRPFTVGEKRKFPRMINSLAESSNKDNIIKNIEDFANASDGAFKFGVDSGNIPDALQLVEYTGADGIKRQAPRWLYETFIKPNLAKERKKS